MDSARALVAEQDVSIREPLARALERRGIRATAVGDAAGALRCFREGRFDIVVLDVALTGADPEEMMRCLALLDPKPIAVGLTADSGRAVERIDGALVPMTVPVRWDLDTLADILTSSAREHHS